jgi:hypothetical protein
MVRQRTYVFYALVYAGSILYSLILLRCRQPMWWALDLALGIAAACLSSLWLFARWTAGRLEPTRYINRLLARIYSLGTPQVGAPEGVVSWMSRILSAPLSGIRHARRRGAVTSYTGLRELNEAVSQAAHVARLAIRDGATLYWELIVESLVRFLILGDLDKDHRLAIAAGQGLRHIMPALAADESSFEQAMHGLQAFFVVGHAQGTPLGAVSLSCVESLETLMGPVLDPTHGESRTWVLAFAALGTVGMMLTGDDDNGMARQLGTFLKATAGAAVGHQCAPRLVRDPIDATAKLLYKLESSRRLEQLRTWFTATLVADACFWDANGRAAYEKKAAQFAGFVFGDAPKT